MANEIKVALIGLFGILVTPCIIYYLDLRKKKYEKQKTGTELEDYKVFQVAQFSQFKTILNDVSKKDKNDWKKEIRNSAIAKKDKKDLEKSFEKERSDYREELKNIKDNLSKFKDEFQAENKGRDLWVDYRNFMREILWKYGIRFDILENKEQRASLSEVQQASAYFDNLEQERRQCRQNFIDWVVRNWGGKYKLK